MAWRAADSLSLRSFLRLAPPDHSTNLADAAAAERRDP